MTHWIDNKSIALTKWIGTPGSLVLHTILFLIAFALPFFGFSFDKILLIVTTIVSLEAIYLAIFIQMTVNRQSEEIKEVGEDIEDIQEDVKEVGEEIEDIQEDVEGIQEDVEDISEDIDRIQEEQEDESLTDEEKIKQTISSIEKNLQKVLAEIESIKKPS